MAGLDYGVVVFRDGHQLYADRLYPDIEVGDFKIMCYKVWADIKYRTGTVSYFGALQSERELYQNEKVKSVYFRCDGTQFHIDEVCDSVYRLRFTFDDQHYTVIYGYGIDNDWDVWNNIKVMYLGKRRAKQVDRAIEKARGGP